MGVSIIYYSGVKGGKLQPSVTKRILSDLKQWEGKRVQIEVCKQKSERSTQQNRYYWGAVVKILAKELGYSTDEIHDLLKFKFLKRNIVIGETEEVIVKSTAELTKSEFMDYISDIQIWSAELGIIIQDPNTQVDLTLE